MKRKQELAEVEVAPQSTAASEPVESYDFQNDVDLLKSLIVSDANLEVFKVKLNATREYRTEMMKKKETEFKEHFPYFFTHPMKLVC